MNIRRGKLATAIAAVAVTAGVAGGVYAAGGSSDEAALEPARPAASKDVEQRVSALLAKMTTEEKLQQVQLLSDGQMNEEDGAAGNREAKAGVGGVFSLVDPKRINELQHIAVEQSRLGIPILFAYDTIHGYRTIFPIPLGAGSSFDPNVVSDDHRFGARESAAVGLKQIYSPMVDVSHEPRWGRISEAAGEDPYLNSVMAAARVKAAQGRDYSAKDKVVTSVKHYAAYGQPEGGRDYGTTDMSEQRLRNLYLPPFKAAIDAGADTAMCSFNAINGVPGCANKRLETDILKNEWDWDGFIESDYTAVDELLNHGTAESGADAGAKALMAGTDSEMVSTEHPRQRREAARVRQDHDGAPRRRGAPHPARQVPRRAVRQPLRRPGQGRGRAGAARRARRGTQGRRPLDGPARERRQAPPARPDQEDGRHRAAGQEHHRHARPVVGPRGRQQDRHRPRRHQRPERRRDVRRGVQPHTGRGRRSTSPRTTAAPTPGSPRPWRRPGPPTRSCSRWARRARTAARRTRAASSTCRVARRS